MLGTIAKQEKIKNACTRFNKINILENIFNKYLDNFRNIHVMKRIILYLTSGVIIQRIP